MDFLKQVAGSKPVPAGGAAVAYTASLAIGLIYKVILVELKRGKDTPGMESNLMTLRRELEKLLRDVEKLVTEDPESYLQFSKSLREGDKAKMKQHYSSIIDVSVKVMEKSDTAFVWVDQLRRLVPKQLITHLLVACELLMGAINGAVHVVRDNIQTVRVPQKRENYLRRIDELHEDCQKHYRETIQKFQ